MDVQGIHRPLSRPEPGKDVKQAREQRLAGHESLPRVKTPDEAKKLISEVRQILLYG